MDSGFKKREKVSLKNRKTFVRLLQKRIVLMKFAASKTV